MPNGDGKNIEQITRPLGTVIRDIGLAVAEGQQQLDDRLHTQYREDADDGLLDRETPWYRFAEVDVDLEMHFHTVEEHESLPEELEHVARKKGGIPDRVQQYGLAATPATPPGTSFSEGEQRGSSRIRFRIVPVSPPSISRGDRNDESDEPTAAESESESET